MDDKTVNTSRRVIINSALGLSAIGAMAPSHWTKPMVKAVILPTHATMSPVCPDIMIDNVTGTIMGSGDIQCSLNFDVLSTDSTPLTVTSIVNTEPSIEAQITYDVFPVEVTDTTGTRVAWTGTFNTPECQNDFASDVVFTVTATCEGVIEPISADFNLADIAAMAVI